MFAIRLLLFRTVGTTSFWRLSFDWKIALADHDIAEVYSQCKIQPRQLGFMSHFHSRNELLLRVGTRWGNLLRPIVKQSGGQR